MKFCIICNNKISNRAKTKLCQSCAAKAKIPEKCGNYKDGRSLKIYHCIICNKIINWQTYLYGTKKCKQHAKQIHLPKCRICGKNLKNYKAKLCKKCYLETLKGESHPSWKGGKSKCIDCNKETNTGHKRCRKCYFKFNRGKNHPLFGKVIHPKYIKFYHTFYHSSWN